MIPATDHAKHYDASPSAHPGLHVIALVEAGKSIVALLIAAALEWFGASPLRATAQALIDRFQMDPRHGAMAWLAHSLGTGTVHLAALGLFFYGALHLIEAWGLWRAKAWASWLGCLTAAAYLPFDIYALATHKHWLEAVIVAINVIVVWVLARDLFKRRH